MLHSVVGRYVKLATDWVNEAVEKDENYNIVFQLNSVGIHKRIYIECGAAYRRTALGEIVYTLNWEAGAENDRQNDGLGD